VGARVGAAAQSFMYQLSSEALAEVISTSTSPS
jgi:hypothetical protein